MHEEIAGAGFAGLAAAIALRRRVPPGEDALVFRTLLEPFWPGRRAHAFDQHCR